MAQVQNKIPLAQLEEMFSSMRTKTTWNVDGPLLWGYFFEDPNEQKLQGAAADLKLAGYNVVEIRSVRSKHSFQLHVERVEVHTPSSLNARNAELEAFVTKHALASYDGMDVGPVTDLAK